MSEQARGLIYRVLTVLFFGLLVFGVVDAEQANQALIVIAGFLGVAGSGLATRNTTVVWRRSKEQ